MKSVMKKTVLGTALFAVVAASSPIMASAASGSHVKIQVNGSALESKYNELSGAKRTSILPPMPSSRELLTA
ncbi:hypothetical protein [Cohnella caldifontis]|uniref:hypothetical protein n=1 Tax=Cohnella caldifontis TaxID=3027471 RepID=UPI0023EE1E33|nr:hypothetical protein [Cohnella sp. YIM B05605]